MMFVCLLKYTKGAYYRELYQDAKFMLNFHYQTIKKGFGTWLDFYLFLDSINISWFLHLRTVWSWYGYRYHSLPLYLRLYLYARNYFSVELKVNEYVAYKREYDIEFDKTNAYFNGVYIPTDPFTFFYTERYHPIIFTSVWYKSFKTLLIPTTITFFLTLLLINFYYINLLRQLAIWAIIGLLFFWLISGFNFFLKRYRYGKFTSAILRFWKRTNAIFWIVEGFLFSLFFYYYLNSSQEPLYFYDTSSLNQDYLLSLTNTYFNYLLLLVLIWYTYYVVLKLPQLIFKQYLIHLTIITLLFIYIFLLESYQLYYVLTLFYELLWVFDTETNMWILETESPRLRVKQQYLLLALIAKYWHFLFIFLGWLFFIFKSFEQKRTFYSLFTWNIQNLIILFLLNILFIAQWLKWLLRRFYDNIYYWFFTDSNMLSIKLSFDEFIVLAKNIFVLADSFINFVIHSKTTTLFNLNLFI